MKRLTLIMLAALFVSLLITTCAYAEVPHLIRFQGKVTDKTGAPLNGAYNITFRIYNAETGGTLKWSETQSAIPVNNGIFTALLGNTTASGVNLPFDVPYWLSMEVNDDGEMAPRQAITSAGYAIHAEVADSIANVSVVPQGAIILWTGASCPQGYTRVTALDGKFIVGGTSYNAAAGGSNTHTHGTGSYQGPSHTHSFSVTSGVQNQAGVYHGGAENQYNGPGHPNHDHTISGTTSSSGTGSITGTSAPEDSRPEFATVIFCEKD